jgi:hypothetical protein
MSHLSHTELNVLRPLLAAQARREAQALYERRATLAEQIQTLDRAHDLARPALEQAATEASDKLKDAEEVYRNALHAAQAAEVELSRATLTHDAQRQRLQNSLEQSAPAEIDTLLADLRNGFSRACDARLYSRTSPTALLELTADGRLKPKIEHYSNTAEVERQVAGIRAAITEAEALRLVALEPDTLAETLNAIRRKALGHLID